MRWRTEKARPRRVSGLPAMRLQPSARGGLAYGRRRDSPGISGHLSAFERAPLRRRHICGRSRWVFKRDLRARERFEHHARGSRAHATCGRRVAVSLSRVAPRGLGQYGHGSGLPLYAFLRYTGLHSSQGPAPVCVYALYRRGGRQWCLQCLQRSLQCLRMSEGSIRQGVHDANH